ncbi:MAG: FlgD immunoglobulin-like domain containing protein [candidate division WOR-3 bacterium]
MRWFLTILLFVIPTASKAQSIFPIDSIQGYGPSSPYVNRTVTTVGVVTATVQDWTRYIRGFFIQDADAPWHGIYVYTGNLTVNVGRGDSVMVTGRVQEYYDLTEIVPSSSSDIIIIKKGVRIPKPIKVTCAEINTEPYEGVLVRVDSVTVINSNVGNYQFQIQDPQGNTALVQNCSGFSYNPSNNDFIPSIVGIDYYSYGAFKIVPRGNEDLIFSGDGTGHFYFINNIIATDEEKEVLLQVSGDSPFQINAVKLLLPQGFQLTGTIILEGDGFQNATFSITQDTIIITGTQITETRTGIIKFTKLLAPSIPGIYAFQVFTLSQSSFRAVAHPPKLNVLSIVGGGNVAITPLIIPKNTQTQINIAISNIFGTLRQVKIVLPSVAIGWDRRVTLIGEGVSTAIVQFAEDTIIITNATIDSMRPASIVFDNFSFLSDSSPLAQFTILTGTQDSVGPVQNQPKVFIALEDTTVKMKYFHIPLTQSFLLGKTVMVKGIVSGVIGDRTYVQDSTGGIIIYRGPALTPNTVVKLIGQYNEYRNSAQLYSASLIANFGVSSIQPDSLEFPPQEIHEGRLVKIFNVSPPDGVTYFIPDSALIFKDSLNREYRVYISSSTDLAYKPIPQGKVDILGCVYQFDANYNIQPRGTKDIIAKGNGTGSFLLHPSYTYYDSTRNINLLVSSLYSPIKSIELRVTGAYIDTVIPVSSGFYNPVVDSYFRDTASLYLKISGGIELTEDTITLVGLRPLSNVEAISFSIKTSVDSGGFLSPVLTDPVLYVGTPIGYARRNGPDGSTPEFLNKQFTVIGVVTAPPYIFSTTRTSMYIQDETGGINVYYAGSLINFNEGDLIRVKGTILQYNGLTEISPASPQDFVLLGQGFPFDTLKLRPGEPLSENLEGLLIQVEGTCDNIPYSSGSGKAFTIYNGLTPIDIYVYNTTSIDLSNVTNGNVYRITGVVGQYDATIPYTSGYQLLPRYQKDIEFIQTTVTPVVSIKITPSVFSPFLGEALRIEVSGPDNAVYNLKIYNSNGRLVKTIANGKTSPFVTEWRGTNEEGAQLSPGLYILLLEYITSDGKTGKLQKTVVLSKPK